MMRLTGPSRKYGTLACLLLLGTGVLFAGCASSSLTMARNAFYSGDFALASQALTDSENVSSRDKLLYYMEKGTILHYSGDYQASADIFLEAAQLIKAQEIISASRQAASLVTSEWLTKYKGEYAERLLVHTYLMMDFLLLGKPESALVEAKQALEVYDTYPEACNDDFFTRALIAHCFETLGEINGAYIEYKKLAGFMGNPAPVADKLCALGAQLGFSDEVEHYRQFLPRPETGNGRQPVGEMLVFASRGRAPVKIPQDIILPDAIRFSFSTYENRDSYYPGADMPVLPNLHRASRVTTNIGQVLRTSLDQRLARIIAKETARVVAKEAIAKNINDGGVESLVRIAFLLMEAPDTRCWETLPGALTLIRVPLFPGDNPRFLEQMGIPLPETADDTTAANRPFYRYYVVRR